MDKTMKDILQEATNRLYEEINGACAPGRATALTELIKMIFDRRNMS
ncbi:hypothetical protein [Oscillibacter ruminantium]